MPNLQKQVQSLYKQNRALIKIIEQHGSMLQMFVLLSAAIKRKGLVTEDEFQEQVKIHKEAIAKAAAKSGVQSQSAGNDEDGGRSGKSRLLPDTSAGRD